MLTLLINESNPLDGLFANSTTGGIGTVPDITVADDGQAISVQSFTRAGGIITDSFVAGDVLHIGIGDGVNTPVCYVELSSASPAVGTMPINTAGMVALFAGTVANQLSLTLAVVRTRGAYTNTIFSAPIVIRRSAINISTAVPTPSILGAGVEAALQVAINTALGFVRLDASARLPAVDGSQLTNVPNELPSQTGNSGKYLTTNGTATSWGTVSTGLTVGTTAITSGTTTRVLFDNAGVLGEYTISGTGSVAMTTSPSFTTPTIGDGTESAPSLSFTSDTNTGVYRPAADTVGIVGGGNDVVRLTGIASATDYLEIKNGIGVGSPLHILAEGASTNIGMHLQPKGSGLFTISDGADFNKGIRFRSSSSAASAITLIDAVSTAGRVVTLPDATGTLALVSGDLGTPSALVGTNITGTAASLTAGNATLAATVTVANEAADTTCFPLFATASTGSLAAKSNAGLTFNSATGLLSATGFAGTTGTFSGAVTGLTFNDVELSHGLSGNYRSVALGSGALSLTTTGVLNTALGNAALSALTSGSYNTAIGRAALATNISGDSNTAIGVNALISPLGSGNVALGFFAGGYETGSNSLYIDNQDRTDTAGDKAKALLYGTFAATAAAQQLTINAGTITLNGSAVTATSFAGAGTGLTGTATSLTAGNATKWTTGRTIALTGDVTYTSAALDGSGNVTGTATLAATSNTSLTSLANLVTVGTLTGGATGAGFTVALSTSTITGTLADARLSANVPLLNAANTFTAANTISTAGANSAAPLNLTGALNTGGTGTTTFPHIFHQPTGATAATTWSSGANSGTVFGCNEATGFLGSFADFRIAGTRHFALGTDGSGNSRLYWGSGGYYIQIVSSTFSCSGGFSVGGGTLATTGGNGISCSGTLSVTGATTLSAALITTPEALAPALNAGAACGVTTVASGFALNGVNALTLANGTNGQIKTVVCTAVTAAGTATLTPTTCSGFTTVAFTAAGQTLTLQYFSTGGWVILSVRGATPA